LCPDDLAVGLNLIRQGLPTVIAQRLDLRMKPTLRLPFYTQKIIAITTLFLFLTGCVGVMVSVPEERTSYTSPDLTTRAWCGVTLWAVIVPIPLQLPVCTLHEGQYLTSPFYACGPLMFLGGLSPIYEGYGLCGMFPK